jgi:DNA-binding transcriptional ArsR family regulator
VLSDASAVRALAHPARLEVIDVLFSGEVLTATECAAIVGITPSAMSYHLRALEKFGIVQRAETRGDGRERPWVRAGDVLRIDLRDKRGAPSSVAATEVLIQSSLALDTTKLIQAMRADATSDLDRTWAGTTTYNRDRLVLTPEEARTLAVAIDELLGPHRAENRRPTGDPGAEQPTSTFAASFLLARDPA